MISCFIHSNSSQELLFNGVQLPINSFEIRIQSSAAIFRISDFENCSYFRMIFRDGMEKAVSRHLSPITHCLRFRR